MSNPERKPTDGDWEPHDDEIPVRVITIDADLSAEATDEIFDAILDATEDINKENLVIKVDIESVSDRDPAELLDE